MSILTTLVMAALLAVIASLVLGIASMVSNGTVGHRSSAQWMTARVTLQALALVFALLAVVS